MRPSWPGRKRWLVLAGLLVCLGGAALVADSHPAARGSGQDPASASTPSSAQEQATAPKAPGAPRGQRLILRDGTFHLVRSYERKGERVRYYSVERSAWEEIPADLVDWEATRKAEEAGAQATEALLEKARAAETATRAGEIDVDASIEYAPGHFLPAEEGFYAVDGITIIPLPSVGADVKLDKGRLLTQILVPIPVVPSRHRIRLKGKKASVRLSTAQPEFYFRTADAREPEVEFLQAQVKGDAREVQAVETNIVGEQSRRGKVVSVQRWKVAKGVYRFTLGEPLPPGEYAVAEYVETSESGAAMSFYLWDFGVDAAKSAPDNKK